MTEFAFKQAAAARFPVTAFCWRVEALLICATLAALLIWDASGLDFWISSKIAELHAPLIQGFSMRHAWLTEVLMHRGGKYFYGVIFILLA